MESSPGISLFAAAVWPVLFRPQEKNGTETRANAAVPKPNLAKKLRRDSPLDSEGEFSTATLRSYRGFGPCLGRCALRSSTLRQQAGADFPGSAWEFPTIILPDKF